MQSQDPATMQSSGAEGAQQETNENENDAGATVVEITFGSDGSITVEQETGAQESAEEGGGGEEAGAAPVTVKNIEQACEVLRQIYAASQKPSAGNEGSDKAEQAAGYSQA
jgi:hypothetical protein